MRSGALRVRTATAIALAVLFAGAPLLWSAARPAHGQDARPTSIAPVGIRGAGATFPAPLYEKWIETYRRMHPDVRITYDAVGSGEGQRRFLGGSVDFGASDAALTDEQIARVRGGARLVPVTAGIVVLAYNLPGLGGPLRLPQDVYVDIFAGRIRNWSDPRLRAANPGLNLPNRTIAVVARQDGSGTTFALTNHLSAISEVWRDRGPGVGTLIDWRGLAMLARGNEGVAARIKVSEDAIGYVEYHFAKRLGLAMAHLQNKSGRYIEPSDRSGQAALADNVKQMPENLRLFLPDPEGAESYPIVSFSWLLLHERYAEPGKAAALKKFVAWGLTEGQALSRELGYIPLPAEVASLSLAAVDRIN
jgi:phosphate transport system substrate-binding protein